MAQLLCWMAMGAMCPGRDLSIITSDAALTTVKRMKQGSATCAVARRPHGPWLCLAVHVRQRRMVRMCT